jgi:hypothetical protein
MDKCMSELKQEYTFHPADLIEYAMDKPVGAARAALAVGLEGVHVYPDIMIGELVGNMELNQRYLNKVVCALRKDSKNILGEMPTDIQVSHFERIVG